MTANTSSWKASKVKYLGRYINGYAFKPSEWGDKGKPIIRIQNLTNPDAAINRYDGTLSQDVLVRDGDILLSWSASLGAYEWKGEDAWLNQHIFKVDLDSNLITKSFFKWLAISFMEELSSHAHGSTMRHLTKDRFGKFPLLLPPLSDQDTIADWLAEETTRMDNLIEAKKSMLQLLQKKRAAMISSAVARGLDPKAPTKPSGLDWLGEIPEHWRVMRLKFLINELTQGSSPVASNTPAETDELGILKLSAISGGRFIRTENKALRQVDDEVHLYSLKAGDVLVTRSNTPLRVGDACMVPMDEPNLLIPDLVYRLRTKVELIHPQFLAHFLITGAARAEIVSDARGSSGTMVKISQDHVRNWSIPIPPLKEQSEIAEYIRGSVSRIDRASKTIEDSIELLRERRSALITSAVTGKIPLEEMSE